MPTYHNITTISKLNLNLKSDKTFLLIVDERTVWSSIDTYEIAKLCIYNYYLVVLYFKGPYTAESFA